MTLHTKIAGMNTTEITCRSIRSRPSKAKGVAVPKHRLPDRPMAADLAYEIIHQELMPDGNARLNLATFVTTWMEPQAERLMAECFDKNMIDKDEYPQTAELEMRCLKRLLPRLEKQESPARDGSYASFSH